MRLQYSIELVQWNDFICSEAVGLEGIGTNVSTFCVTLNVLLQELKVTAKVS